MIGGLPYAENEGHSGSGPDFLSWSNTTVYCSLWSLNLLFGGFSFPITLLATSEVAVEEHLYALLKICIDFSVAFRRLGIKIKIRRLVLSLT